MIAALYLTVRFFLISALEVYLPTLFRPSNAGGLRRRHRPQHPTTPQHHLRHRWLDSSHNRRAPSRRRRSPKDAYGCYSRYGSVSGDRSRDRGRLRQHWQQDSFRRFDLVHIHLWLGLCARFYFDATDLPRRGPVQRHAREGHGYLPIDVRMRRVREHVRCTDCA